MGWYEPWRHPRRCDTSVEPEQSRPTRSRVWDAAKFPPASGTLPLCAVNIDVPVTDLDATEHDTVVLATPNGLTAIRLDAGLLMDQAAYSAPG